MPPVKKATKKPARRTHFQKPSTPKETPWSRPLALIVYGPPGVGKSSFAAQFPDVALIHDPDEDGINDLIAYKHVETPKQVIEVSSWNHLMETITDNIGKLLKQGVKSLVIDSMTGMEQFCFRHHCHENFDGDWSKTGFFAYQQGPKNAAKTDWRDFISALSVAQQEGLNVILLAHSQVKPYSNPVGPDYDRYLPYMDKETWQHIHRWAQIVMFMNYHFDMEKQQGIKSKAKTGTARRMLFTEWDPAYDAKNLIGIEPTIDGGESGLEAYRNFLNSFPTL